MDLLAELRCIQGAISALVSPLAVLLVQGFAVHMGALVFVTVLVEEHAGRVALPLVLGDQVTADSGNGEMSTLS